MLYFLLQLPSHRFRYSVWHDLSHTDVKGPQLKAPRIRYGKFAILLRRFTIIKQLFRFDKLCY